MTSRKNGFRDAGGGGWGMSCMGEGWKGGEADAKARLTGQQMPAGRVYVLHPLYSSRLGCWPESLVALFAELFLPPQ